MTRYATICADPPWAYKSPGEFVEPIYDLRRASSAHRYGSMSVDEICALRPPAADNAHLYLWTTNAFMVEAHRVAEAWGFKQKTILTWGKLNADGDVHRGGMGYYYRGATEHVLFCVRGSLRIESRSLPTLFHWPKTGAHSRKPQEFYDMVREQSPGPYLEMFAREPREGWDVWGNEVESDVSIAYE